MVGIGGHYELPDAQQVVLTKQAVHPFRIDHPPIPAQGSRDARPTVAGPFQRNPLDGVAQIHVAIQPLSAAFFIAIEVGAAHAAQFHHPRNRQPPVRLHFFLDFPVDRGFPVSACSIRCSSMRCQHPFKKSISSAC